VFAVAVVAVGFGSTTQSAVQKTHARCYANAIQHQVLLCQFFSCHLFSSFFEFRKPGTLASRGSLQQQLADAAHHCSADRGRSNSIASCITACALAGSLAGCDLAG
jgi:hypothetical protein